ncbi:MAG: hypothetical protein KGS09_19520 [Nitrospirae bacterium]|nr:hypothetical protein [Nitrospirota bacterium]MDE3050110.1 hypothetical protein [Nitrospirota bacterium]MDE3218919.1 hypothetical protein [Nitrospirota bacterium]
MSSHTPKFLSLVLAGVLTFVGCASRSFVPSSLDAIEETTTVLARTPVGEPEIHILTHVDGLGWSVQAEQTIRRDLAVTIRERWAGDSYTAGSPGRQRVLTGITPISCPASLVADLGLHLIKFVGLLDPPRPSWGVMYTGCLLPLSGLDPGTKTPTFETYDTVTDDRRRDRLIEPIQTGRMALLWTHPRYDPVGIEFELTPQHPAAHFRLRQLTALVLHTHSPATISEGQLSVRYSPADGSPSTVALRTPPDVLLTASTPDLVARPAQEWPIPIRLRFSTDASAADAGLVSSLLDHLTDQLVADRYTVVTRGAEENRLVRIQQQHLSPQFQEHASAGQWTGANVLLDIGLTSSSPETRTMRVSAISIETGQLLGTYTIEGVTNAWESGRVSVSSQLRELLPSTPRGRAGTLIDERR